MRESRGGLVITVGGELVEDADTSDLSSPTLLVVPVSDALKKTSPDGLVESHVDRDTAWRVVAYYLDDRTSHVLGSEMVKVGDIHRRVIELGSGWQARPMEEVSRRQGASDL